MKKFMFVFMAILLSATLCSAQQINFPTFTPSIRATMFSDSVVIRQDGKDEISLNSLGFTSSIVAWQVGILANSSPLFVGYSFVPSLTFNGNGKLVSTLQVGSTVFGPQSSSGSGGTSSNDAVVIDASFNRHRVEMAYALLATSQLQFLPRVAVEIFPIKFSIVNSDAKKSEALNFSPSVVKFGIVIQERIPYFLVSGSFDLLTGSRASGYDAEIGLTFLPRSNANIFLSGGYRQSRAVFGFDAGSVNILVGGPFVQAEIIF